MERENANYGRKSCSSEYHPSIYTHLLDIVSPHATKCNQKDWEDTKNVSLAWKQTLLRWPLLT